LPLAHFNPAELIRLREPFDSTEYVFELKMDGFRGLAHIAGDGTRLVSRRGNVYKSFPRLCAAILNAVDCDTVLDGEIVCLDAHGRPQFYELLRRRGDPVFYAFDVLWMDGADLRERPLVERKRVLRSIIPAQSSCLLFADHVDRCGVKFFRLACQQDLEGVVAKLAHGTYGERWYKIRNPAYTQYEGRADLFERRYTVDPGTRTKRSATVSGDGRLVEFFRERCLGGRSSLLPVKFCRESSVCSVVLFVGQSRKTVIRRGWDGGFCIKLHKNPNKSPIKPHFYYLRRLMLYPPELRAQRNQSTS